MAGTERDRSTYLGGSDAAAVLGVSPWMTPVELWQQKTGIAKSQPFDAARERVLARGKRLEPVIVEMAVDALREMGLAVEVLERNARYYDSEHDFLSCEIDFVLEVTGAIVMDDRIVSFDREVINGDAKSVTTFVRHKWGTESVFDVPIEYASQFMHGLMLTGRRWCVVAALIGLDAVAIYWVERDEETIAAMREKEVRFWQDCVIGGAMPDPLDFADIKALFPHDNGGAIEATEEIALKVGQLATVRRNLRDWERDEELLAFQIGDYIRPNAVLTYQGAEIATFRGHGRSDIDQKALRAKHPKVADEVTRTSVVRTLRIPKPKGTR